MEPNQVWLEIAVRHGILFGVLLVAYGLAYRLARLHRAPVLVAVFYLLMPVIPYFVIAELVAAGGPVSFALGVKAAALAVVLAALIHCLDVYVFNRFVDNSLIRRGVESRRESLKRSGMDEERLKAAMIRAGRVLEQPQRFVLVVFVALAGFGCLAAVAEAQFLLG